MTKGIDVSSWQGNIDFKKVKAAGIEFVIVRDGFASSYDSMFLKNVKGFKAAGIKVPAIYHFAYPLSDRDAINEAEFAVKAAKEAELPKSTAIFYDFEYDSENYCIKNGITPTKDDIVRWTELFCETVKASGYVPGVYFNHDYYTRIYGSAIASKYKVWYANWSSKAPTIDYDYHQYSSKGTVNGISGFVDMNNGNDQIKMEEPKLKSIDEIADEVVAGKWGNGVERKNKLSAAGYSYDEVQAKVNEKYYSAPKTKSIDEIADEVIRGDWGNGYERKKKLQDAGYSYSEVQTAVNKKLYS